MPNIEKAAFDESLNKYLLDCDLIQVMQACLVEPDIPDKWFERTLNLPTYFLEKNPTQKWHVSAMDTLPPATEHHLAQPLVSI